MLDNLKLIKKEIKELKDAYQNRRKDFGENQKKWAIAIQNTKTRIENLIQWINDYGQVNVKWDLPFEILEQLDKFDFLEEYIENLKKQVQSCYQQQKYQSQNAKQFSYYLRLRMKNDCIQ
ncbi:unnamed protein product (macronuclear) [Paramecium tetraurelia]|uniref:Uncharacterized protein n=1 Tax=Paramecium tetraurelia TaxID=5888 RepID=A0BRF1_PARTE|nr:uncharacterized protein GSPATT00031349001 [Paramecium tetraurelia]CAK61118.1 unnamed protein product [Paramecium tetraurelia]|eukprot:XP_001428516.1 hypothetical protein (macronuclear) [Paramecium tetraurelia strain d4-2]